MSIKQHRQRNTFAKGIVAFALTLTLVISGFAGTLSVFAAEKTHVVRSGESWWSIGSKYGVNYNELARHNGKVSSQYIYIGETLKIPGGKEAPSVPAPSPPERTHVVVRNESWWGIALKYGVNYNTLAAHNGKSASQHLYIGEVLKIPGTPAPAPIVPTPAPSVLSPVQPVPTPAPAPPSGVQTHTVVRGESWWSISLKYRVNMNELARVNGKTTSQYIYVGQVLNIPGSASAPPVVPVTPTPPAPSVLMPSPPVPTPAPAPAAQTHTVVRNESWWSIGLKYRVNMNELARVNGKTTSQVLYIGQVLQIPGTGTTSPAPAPSPAAPTPSAPLPLRPPVTLTPNAMSAAVHAPISSNGYTTWNSEYTTPYLMNMDMASYIGRSKNSEALKGIVVIVDPGHGGTDPGGVSYVTGSAVAETSINTPLSLRIRAELEALGATVIMTRTENTYRSLYGRVYAQGQVTVDMWERELKAKGLDTAWLDVLRAEMQGMDAANSSEAAGSKYIADGTGVSRAMRQLMDAQHQLRNVVFISVHTNIGATSVPRGQQIFITPKHTAESLEVLSDETPNHPNYQHHNDTLDLRFAQAILTSVQTAAPEMNSAWTRIVDEYSYAVVRHTAFPAILFEAGYTTNLQDLRNLQNAATQQRIAKGIADGVFTYFTRH